MARTAAPDTRERILDVASDLFYTHGVHAVGMQQLIDAFGCGKNLVYREFPSKEALHLAYLAHQREIGDAKFSATIAPYAGDPVRQLLALVRSGVADAQDPEFQGCPFSRSSVEFPEESDPVQTMARDQRTARTEQILAIATETGARNPEALTSRIILILDGLMACGPIHGCNEPAKAAEQFAAETIRAALAS